MEKYSQELIFKYIDGYNYHQYYFKRIPDGLLFSPHTIEQYKDNEKFINNNFQDLSKCYYQSMVWDNNLEKKRKRKLSTFIKSIYDQDDDIVKLLMIKAVSFFIDQNLSEDEIIEKIIKEILPNACFKKEKNENYRYVWKYDETKKFKIGIGKVFVLNYINNDFNKDKTWKFIKKYCFLKDNVWKYKNDKCKNIMFNFVKSHFKNGGIIMEEVMNQKFDAFIPLKKSSKGSFLLEKDSKDGNKRVYLIGEASNTEVDRDDERMSKNFIQKMQSTAIGLPLLVKSHYTSDIDDTIGVITDTGGNDDSFLIEARLQKEENNGNIKKIMGKMEDEIKYGFSVGGRITKAYREFNEDLKKEILVLDDGELYHVLLTNQPANPQTFSEAIFKSLDKKDNKEIGGDNEKVTSENGIDFKYKHSSKICKDECPLEEINFDKLPDSAFPIDFNSGNTVHKEYPHHFINNDVLYIHRNLLIQQYYKAVSKKAPEFVLNHLMTHILTSGLQKQAEAIKNIMESVEDFDDVKELIGKANLVIGNFVKDIKDISMLNKNIGEKRNMMKELIGEASIKLETVLSHIDIDEEIDNG